MRSTIFVGLLTAAIVSGGIAKAEEISLTCRYDYQNGNGIHGKIAEKPFDVDVNEKRVLVNGENRTSSGADFVEISARYITYGSRPSSSGSVSINTVINRQTLEIRTELGPTTMTGSCSTARL